MEIVQRCPKWFRNGTGGTTDRLHLQIDGIVPANSTSPMTWIDIGLSR
jgi:hypothetical protein